MSRLSSTIWSRIGRRLPADAALNLAVFRIVVALLFLTTGEVRDAPAWASLSPSLAVAPRGWGWALALFPPNALAARVASLAVIAGAVLGAVGLFTRAAFTVLVVAALYLLALPLRNGMPYHYQHLVWFAAICAASPCADALALDSWRRRRGEPPPPRSPAYGVPLRVAWLLVGVIFFFPGLWKLRTLGLDWITSDNLRNQMYWKWASTGFTPPFRIDRSPALLHAGAAAAVALELSFVCAIWTRWSRRVAIAAALVFHASARGFMGIDFSALWLTYVMFIDWHGLARRWLRRSDATLPPAPSPLARLAPALIAGAMLIAGAVEAGARGAISGWPFACYPTFQDRAATRIPALAIRLVRDGGDEVSLDVAEGVAPSDSAREWIFGARLLASTGAPDADVRFAAYWRRLGARTHAGERWPDIRAVRFYAAEASTIPEERDRPPRLRALAYELRLERPPTMMPRARNGAITSFSSDAAARSR